MSEFDAATLDQVEDLLFGSERKRLEEQRREDMDRLRLDMASVLASEQGRRVIFWIMERGGLMRADYNGRSMDLAYDTGRKSVASEVLGLALVADPKIFTRFIDDRLTQQEEANNG